MRRSCFGGRQWICAMILFCGLAGVCRAEPSVVPGQPSYGIWAPEFRELHVSIPLELDPGTRKDEFSPTGVMVDGVKPVYAMWYFDATPFDYIAIPDASACRVNVFVPVFWKPGDRHVIRLEYKYGGVDGSVEVEAVAPAQGGAWPSAVADANLTFLVRETAGVARNAELVEFDVIFEQSRIPDPEKNVRTTIYTHDGQHHEVPCQVYAVEPVTQGQLIHFRVAVPLSVAAGSETLICLWNTNDDMPRPQAGPLHRQEAEDAVTVANEDYAIRLSSRSGQLMSWKDLRRKVLFDYQDPRKLEEWSRVINRTPDVYRVGKPWSHAFDWKPGDYEEALIKGDVFIETVRRGKMPFTEDEFSATVRYRFTAGSPEVRIGSVLSADQDSLILGLRNGGICVTTGLFTHAAWPVGDGRIEKISLDGALGNDTGSPAAARLPVHTPWTALWNADKGYGFGVYHIRQAYFGKNVNPPTSARQMAYVSVYRHMAVYLVRSYTQTYNARIRTLPVPIHAGTELFEEMVWAPFSLAGGEDADALQEVLQTHRRLTHPLVVVP